MVRAGKPYQRNVAESTHKRGNPDGPGAWKHDLHQNVKQSLASRLSSSASGASSSSSRPSLLSRISGGKGKELLPAGSIASSASAKLHGFGEGLPVNTNHPNAGLELLPGAIGNGSGSGSGSRRGRGGGNVQKGRLVESGLNAALGLQSRRNHEVRPLVSNTPASLSYAGEGVSIMGAARGTIWVRVENLAAGTTGEDVMSAFAPAPVLSARNPSTSFAGTVTVEIEIENRQAAEEIVERYNGIVADGNTLAVSIVKPKLAERFGVAKSVPISTARSNGGQELLQNRSSSKMYSDTILASDPRSAIITLADESAAAKSRRADAWSSSRPSLAQRVGAGRR